MFNVHGHNILGKLTITCWDPDGECNVQTKNNMQASSLSEASRLFSILVLFNGKCHLNIFPLFLCPIPCMQQTGFSLHDTHHQDIYIMLPLCPLISYSAWEEKTFSLTNLFHISSQFSSEQNVCCGTLSCPDQLSSM